MKYIDGKITISRPVSNINPDSISIEIKDKNSCESICKVSVDLESFARALTGLAYMPCSVELFDFYEKAGRKLITLTVECPKTITYNKEDQRKLVIEDFNRNYKDEWELYNDGTSSQQNGNNHYYVIKKYVEIANGK